MKRWSMSLLLVGLVIGLQGLLVFDVGVSEVNATATTYTFKVYVKYSDTNQPASYEAVRLTDTTTGSKTTKYTDGSGYVTFTPSV
ncbi:MAG: hypothetical protein J7L88_02175, partial [Thermoplasmata archaeon]|nr:hypothetical protein [Thermoplasmata archaeon]